MNYQYLLEKNWLPDFAIRWKIKQLLKQRLNEEDKKSDETNRQQLLVLIEELKHSPVAVETETANEQHYEMPAEFFRHVLGRHMKYSCSFFENGIQDLTAAEKKMLELTYQHAELKNGMEILELGCGWGSLSLFMAEKFPQSRITGVSNSHTQKVYINGQAKQRNISNLEIITADMNHFFTDKKFDRVVSVEMFEHMRNYYELMKRISSWIKDDGKLFVHIFAHKKFAYKFEVKDESDWMSKYFFTGGIMPSSDLLFYFDEHLLNEKSWKVNGIHYAKTSEAWLANMDKNKPAILKIFSAIYGEKNALKWFVYWRVFFMACAELWRFNNGNEWMVCHYLFKKKFVEING